MDPERKPEFPSSNCPNYDTISPFLTCSIADIDRNITFLQNSLSLYPRSRSEYINCVYNLAEVRWARYQLSQAKQDLNKSIVYCTEAIFLPPISRGGTDLNNAFQLLFLLASALLVRSAKFEQPEGVKYSIDYLRYLRGLPLDHFDIPRNIVTTLLIQALNTQGRLEAGDMTQIIKEMVVLCHELLSSNILVDLPTSIRAFMSLYLAVNVEFHRGRPILLLDEVIECLRDAVKVFPPDSYEILYALADLLATRVSEPHSNDDYEEATALLDRILHPDQPGGCPDSIRDLASSLATALAFFRSLFGNPEDFEMTTSRLRTLLSTSSDDERLRLHITDALAIQARERFRQYSLDENIEEANSYASQVADLSSSASLEKSRGPQAFLESSAVRDSYLITTMAEKIQHLEELLSNSPPGSKRHKMCLIGLVNWYNSKFHHTNDISDVEESIKYCRLSLDATHSSDPLRFSPLSSLHSALDFAFKKTGKISYLDESIAVGYNILELRHSRHIHFRAIRALVQSLLSREQILGGREDLHEAIRLISTVIDDQYTREPDRFQLSCQWAIIARSIGHPITLAAYKCAMSLMKKSLFFAPTVSVQHMRLVAMGEDCQTMPLDYASFQINLGRFEEAIETLEQGRALLWSELRGLRVRTPIAQLIGEDSLLSKRFAEVNQELEALTTSVTPSGRPEIEDDVGQSGDGMDPFGRLVIRRRKLVEERDTLISKIQGQPELERMLSAPSFNTLRSAASRGPVVVINHCEWRSDILIIFHKSLPCSIPTADDFYTREKNLRDDLVEARKDGLDSGEYQDALCSVLKGLYELVGKPVIKRLRVLGVSEQSRIWWCPTSVFCSLPLHAMGPIPSSNISEQYFSDLYIPSYTPSLSALIESRKTSPQILERPSLLLVAQPDDTLPGVKGEIKVIRKLEEQVTVTSLVSSEATPSSVVEGLRGSRLAHFACHGVLETGKPFEASFKLHGGSRLTLLDVIQSRLPDAEFAFLSCCHAAEITEESIADEGLHLTAAMQYCGFRSVVGTMWEMADTDGRDLAKSFYEALFCRQDAGVAYYEGSAHALRDATWRLRKKRGITLERWVNFVHYGA